MVFSSFFFFLANFSLVYMDVHLGSSRAPSARAYKSTSQKALSLVLRSRALRTGTLCAEDLILRANLLFPGNTSLFLELALHICTHLRLLTCLVLVCARLIDRLTGQKATVPPHSQWSVCSASPPGATSKVSAG